MGVRIFGEGNWNFGLWNFGIKKTGSKKIRSDKFRCDCSSEGQIIIVSPRIRTTKVCLPGLTLQSFASPRFCTPKIWFLESLPPKFTFKSKVGTRSYTDKKLWWEVASGIPKMFPSALCTLFHQNFGPGLRRLSNINTYVEYSADHGRKMTAKQSSQIPINWRN